jgi:hypothetical protein
VVEALFGMQLLLGLLAQEGRRLDGFGLMDYNARYYSSYLHCKRPKDGFTAWVH